MADKISAIEKYNSILPSAKESFLFRLAPLSEIKDSCIFVLDTNVLLAPFVLGSQSIEEIRKLYTRLTKENKMFIPAQVAREFIATRAKKIGEIKETLSRNQQQSFNTLKSIPLLSSLNQYSKLIEAEKKIEESIKESRQHYKDLLSAMESWAWNDPISNMYQDIFADSILDLDLLYKDISVDLIERNLWKIPPGNADDDKGINAGGDLVIWKEILKLAEEKNTHLILVTQEQKNDWWHRSGKEGLYPRFELIDEFRRATKGKSFHIINLSKMLNLFIANQSVIDDVEVQESSKLTNQEDSRELARVMAGNIRSRMMDLREKYGYIILDLKEAYFKNDSLMEHPVVRAEYQKKEAIVFSRLREEYATHILPLIDRLRILLEQNKVIGIFYSPSPVLTAIPLGVEEIKPIIDELTKLVDYY